VPLVEFKVLTKPPECLSPQEEDNQSEVLLQVVAVVLLLVVELVPLSVLLQLLLTNHQLQLVMLDLIPLKSVEVVRNVQDVTRLSTLMRKSRLVKLLGTRDV